jgi:hypothetical protein
MSKGRIWIPGTLYRLLPAVYVGSGASVLYLISNFYGTLSGVLFITAGLLVIARRQAAAGKSGTGNHRKRTRKRIRSTELRWEDYLRPRGSAGSPAEHHAGVEENGPVYGDTVDTGHTREGHVKLVPGEGDPVTGNMLSRFSPFAQLEASQRERLADGLTVSWRPPGTPLITRGSLDDTSLYLIQGVLMLEASDGKRMTIRGGTPRARLPICQLRPHLYSVTAVTDAAMIMLSQSMVRDITQDLAREKHDTGIQVSERAP